MNLLDTQDSIYRLKKEEEDLKLMSIELLIYIQDQWLDQEKNSILTDSTI
jgi:DTW domain-containing protein YfiP